MYATDRRQTKASLNAPPIRGGGIIILTRGKGNPGVETKACHGSVKYPVAKLLKTIKMA